MVQNQQYEDYWKITLWYTDINDDKFIGTLRIIKDFIDENEGRYNAEIYRELQTRVNETFRKNDMTSVRKSINQFVKLGFIEPFLKGYSNTVDDFLKATTAARRKSLFSQTVYQYSSFNSAVTKPSQGGHLMFLIKTLEEVGKLEREDIGALMTQDIGRHGKGYLTKDELDTIKQQMTNNDFLTRKYNQLSHFRSVLSRLEKITFKENSLYFTDDAERLFPTDAERIGRDSYLHRVFKGELENESKQKTGVVACMVEQISYPILVASHIKPWRHSETSEAYDRANGLLLTRSMDALFDRGDISFEDDGKIILCDALSPSAQSHLRKLGIRNEFLSPDRSRYLSYHRKNILSG